MPLIKKFYPTGKCPDVFVDGRTKHVVLSGQAHDPNTLLPVIGTTHTNAFDQSSGVKGWAVPTYDGAAGYFYNSEIGEYGSTYNTENGLTVNVYDDDDGYGRSSDVRQIAFRTDWWGRDFDNHPATQMFYSDYQKRYFQVTPEDFYTSATTTSQYYTYEAENDGYELTHGEECSQARGDSNWIMFYKNNEYGMLGVVNGNIGRFHHQVRANKTNVNPDWKDYTPDTLLLDLDYADSCMLTELDNGDTIHWAQFRNFTYCGQKYIYRISNDLETSETVVSSYANTWNTTNYIPAVPSNIVVHSNSGDVQNDRKVCWDNNVGDISKDLTNYYTPDYLPYRIAINTSNGHIDVVQCVMANNDTYTLPERRFIYYADDRTSHTEWFTDSRIISPGGFTPTSQKYMMLFQSHIGDRTHTATDNYDTIEIYEIDPNDDRRLERKFGQKLADITGIQGGWACPWGVAPLNEDHTVMVFFFYNETSIIRFVEETKSLELVANLGIHYGSFTKLSTGRILAICRDQYYSYRGKEIHVLTDDLVYRVDYKTDTDEVVYDGTNTQTVDVGITTHSANNNQVAATIEIEIVGNNAIWTSGGGFLKTITTSATANTVETVTIVDDGYVQFNTTKVIV